MAEPRDKAGPAAPSGAASQHTDTVEPSGTLGKPSPTHDDGLDWHAVDALRRLDEHPPPRPRRLPFRCCRCGRFLGDSNLYGFDHDRVSRRGLTGYCESCRGGEVAP